MQYQCITVTERVDRIHGSTFAWMSGKEGQKELFIIVLTGAKLFVKAKKEVCILSGFPDSFQHYFIMSLNVFYQLSINNSPD
jgi:hypothetical protein